MIGVLAPGSDHEVVSEFFELFKTPWEYFKSGCKYDVILCVGQADIEWNSANIVVHYADGALAIDAEEKVDASVRTGNELLSHNGRSLVIYGNHLNFYGTGKEEATTDKQWAYRRKRGSVTVNRIGFDLFAEIGKLVTVGQPAEFAATPTLDLHISLLRDMIVESGGELIEIPAVPEGFGCIACLTHDIDHPAIKNHKWDATALGFLYRATVGSAANLLRGRLSVRSLVKNWMAALKLPLVYLGMADDFWAGFEDRYLKSDMGSCSTYFVIPFRDYPGNDVSGPAPTRRAVRYAAQEIQEVLARIQGQGCEVALHGIDAWCDDEAACRELNEIRQFVPNEEIGVRMHWLFCSEKTPSVLERVGAAYDSTIGYRETVGFRAGTTQVYKLTGTTRLLELPMHVMDTALFYPAYLGLSQQEAESRVRRMIEAVVEFGGCLTLNWHDRSLAAERNWDSCYRALINDLRRREAWFATAGQATSWFRVRRSVVFESDSASSYGVRVTLKDLSKVQLPGMRLRVHKLQPGAATGGDVAQPFVDIPLTGAVERCQALNSGN